MEDEGGENGPQPHCRGLSLTFITLKWCYSLQREIQRALEDVIVKKHQHYDEES